ncbi:probable magnesium transporter NIPA6 [Tanacetum coccineum]
MGVSENTTGLILAVLSSGFIGTSFILKKKGLKKAAATTGYGAENMLVMAWAVVDDLQFTFLNALVNRVDVCVEMQSLIVDEPGITSRTS